MSIVRLLCAGLFVCVSWVPVAHAKLPLRNMTVELRVVSQADLQSASQSIGYAAGDAAYVVRSNQQRQQGQDVQKVFVLNGERAKMRLGLSVPVQWVGSAMGVTGQVEGKSVQTNTMWMDAGQGFSVKVSWPGGKQPAAVDIEVDGSAIDNPGAKSLPTQSRSHVATNVLAELGEWVTVATSGRRAQVERSGVYSSGSTESDESRVVQIRVLAP